MYYFEGVSLLVTHYNRSTSLERLIRTFDRLNCRFEEIIVSDDSSRDVHLEKLREIQKTFPFRLITAAENKGLGNNINKGQEAVVTPLTLYVQEDFVPTSLFPEKMRAAVQLMADDRDLDMVRFYAYFNYPYRKPLKHGFSQMIFKPWLPGYRKFYYYSDHPHLRRSTFPFKFGRYQEGLKVERTEYEMMMSFLKKRGKGLFFDDFQSLFIQKNSSEEPSTVHRNFWRESKNPVITMMRHLYRHCRFNFDLYIK
jgi:glycosyltransferase involved in cell wall biosynthesis